MKIALLLASMLLSGSSGALGAATTSSSEDKEARRVMGDFASCVVKRHHAVAARAVVEDWDNDALINSRERPVDGDCLYGGFLSVRLRMSGPLMKAALAEALITRDKVVLARSDVPAGPLEYRGPTPLVTTNAKSGKPLSPAAIEAQQKAIADKTKGIALILFGECAVRGDPEGAAAVLATKLDTPAEMAAIKALAPAMGKCLTAGTKLELNRTSVRAAIAPPYYRLAMAARGITWSGTNPTTAPGAAR